MTISFAIKYLVRYCLLTILSILLFVTLVVLGLSVDLLVNGPRYLALTITNLINRWHQELVVEGEEVMDGLLEARDGLWFHVAVIIIVVIASIMVVIIMVGCVGSCRLSYSFLSGFSLALFIYLMMVGSGFVWLYANSQKNSVVEKFLRERIKLYSESGAGLIGLAMDSLQRDMQCCGLRSPGDWTKLPSSCCPQSCPVGWDCGQNVSRCSKDKVFHTGCLDMISKQLLEPGTLVGVTGISVLVVTVLMVVTFILSLCLCLLARKNREEVSDKTNSNMTLVHHWDSPTLSSYDYR